jgi:hypothetical protein
MNAAALVLQLLQQYWQNFTAKAATIAVENAAAVATAEQYNDQRSADAIPLLLLLV